MIKGLLLIFPLFYCINVHGPIHVTRIDPNNIENTNINFNNMDLSKLIVYIYQGNCFNYNRYRFNFSKGKDGYFVKVYGYSVDDYKKIIPLDNCLIGSSFIKTENLKEIKNLLVTNDLSCSTVHNEMIISYEGTYYTFFDNDPSPPWQQYIHKVMKNTNAKKSIQNTYISY